MKRTILIAAAMLVAGTALAGCCNKCRKAREAAEKPLQGVVWHLVRFDGQAVDAPGRYEVSFLADGNVAGIGECNRFFGTYQVLDAGGSIKFGPFGMMRMACPNDTFESEFVRIFEDVHLYQFDDKYLYLFVGNKVRAVFEPLDKPVE